MGALPFATRACPPAFDCSEANRSVAVGSRSMRKLTAPLQRVQTPSKSTTGIVAERGAAARAVSMILRTIMAPFRPKAMPSRHWEFRDLPLPQRYARRDERDGADAYRVTEDILPAEGRPEDPVHPRVLPLKGHGDTGLLEQLDREA